MHSSLVSIITVNFNSHQVTEDLLHSIFITNTYSAIEIIVVDNGSQYNPVPEWIFRFPSVRFIRSEINLGFAGGNNLGTASATGDYLFYVNNDTIFTESLINVLVKKMQSNAGIGMISPIIHYFDQPDLIQYAGYTDMNFFTARNSCIGLREPDKGQYNDRANKTGYAHGAAMMVSRKAIDKAGLMAENFFLYYEELDWCERIKKAGFEIWVEPNAAIYHKESVSVGKQSALKEYYMNRNRILFQRKHAPAPAYVFFVVYFALFVAPRNILQYIVSRQYNFITVFFKAMWWNLTNKRDSTYLYFPSPK